MAEPSTTNTGSSGAAGEDLSDYSDISDQDESSVKGKMKATSSSKDSNKPVKRRSSKACECEWSPIVLHGVTLSLSAWEYNGRGSVSVAESDVALGSPVALCTAR